MTYTTLKENLRPVDYLYQTSIDGDNKQAINYAGVVAKHGNNLCASIVAANLIIHRGKDVDTGFQIYDAVIKCALHHNFTKIAVQALDNKWRMIHHHPSIVKKSIDEALSIVKDIYTYNPDYSSTELAILYDFKLGKYDKASQEYIKALDSSDDTIDKKAFWLFHPVAIKFLYSTSQLMPLLSESNTLDIDHTSVSIDDWFNTCPIVSNFYEIPQQCAFDKNTELLLSHAEFTVKLHNPVQFEQEIRDFIFSKDNVNDMTNLFNLVSHYGITILTTISNVIAGSNPSLALEILQHESSIMNSTNVWYAVGDFQLSSSPDLEGIIFNKTDFIPELC